MHIKNPIKFRVHKTFVSLLRNQQVMKTLKDKHHTIIKKYQKLIIEFPNLNTERSTKCFKSRSQRQTNNFVI